LGHLNLVFPAGMENSYVQTRAFTSLFLAALAVMTLWSGREDLFSQLGQLPGVAGRLLDHHSPSAARLGRDLQFDRFYFLGSGPRYGLACELSLKMKEMSLTHSEPFHFMEFRHGPKTMLTGSTLLVGLVSQASHENERAVLEEMRREGASILDLGESDTIIPFHSGLDEAVRNVLYLPIGQLIALERALAKQIDPDRPHNLDAVVKLEI
jgi:glucosamine--fructose-6-phosphate aminotransferase (isomerizing)